MLVHCSILFTSEMFEVFRIFKIGPFFWQQALTNKLEQSSYLYAFEYAEHYCFLSEK